MQKNNQQVQEAKRKYRFSRTKINITSVLEKCADIIEFKPITRSGMTQSPIQQIKKKNSPIVIKNDNYSSIDDNELCNPTQQKFYKQLLATAI